MKLYIEEQYGFTIGTSHDYSEIVDSLKHAILNHAVGYNEVAIIHYKRSFQLMFDSLNPQSDNTGYDLIDEAMEYLTGFYDNNPFESFTVDNKQHGKANEYLVEVVTKTGLIFDIIVIDNTDKQIRHLSSK